MMSARLQKTNRAPQVSGEQTTGSPAPNSTAFARWWAEYQEKMGTGDRVAVRKNKLNFAQATTGRLPAK